MSPATHLTWREAIGEALYGPGGFFRREAPADHFRTAPVISPAFASAVLALARTHELGTIIDMGAGRGELLRTLHHLDPNLRLVGVELAERPADLPEAVEWTASQPNTSQPSSGPPSDGTTLVIANEWLDNVPVDVVEVDPAGTARVVLVDPATGDERLGDPVDGADLAWLERWWPLADAEPGTRAEVGWPRDEAWARVLTRMRHGVAVAIDYAHMRADRPPFGSLTGYRSGRQCPPVPDGSCDLTAHVAIDACAAAADQVVEVHTRLTTQREALIELGVRATPPDRQLARDDPRAYLAALSQAGECAELVARDGLGGHRWLIQQRADIAAPNRLEEPDTVPAIRADSKGADRVRSNVETT